MGREKRDSSWGSHEGRPAAIIIFFDGGVDGVGGSRNNHHFLAGAGWSMQTSDETGQDPKWQTRLQVCCAVSQATTVTQAEMRAATEAVKAVVSSLKHCKVMINLDGRRCWRIRRIPSRELGLVTRGKETAAFKAKRSVLMREPRLPNFC